MRDSCPHWVDENFVVSYLCHLFSDRSFSPNTIKNYKAALCEPLRLAFGIDLQDDNFFKVIWAFSFHRPMPAPGFLSWSLDKVLAPLALIDPRSCTFLQLLDKTIFLIVLASGG